MALAVLDGNQSATTLSSVVTGGEHIVAHSVVSLGATAISNITSAVSGSVVSVSNFPATQTIAGTVTANVPLADISGGISDYISGTDSFVVSPLGGVTFPISGTVTVGNSVTIGAMPAISGTVTANVGFSSNVGEAIPEQAVLIAYNTNNFMEAVGENTPLPISGTVTVGNSVTIGSLPAISGTVTAAAPNGSLTTRFGTPTTANTAFETSAVTKSDRKYLLIQNVTTQSNVITVGIGFTPTTTQGIQLTAGAGITFESSYIPTGQIYILSSVTASNFTILEA